MKTKQRIWLWIYIICATIISSASIYLTYDSWDSRQLHLYRFMYKGEFRAWYCLRGNESFGYGSIQFEKWDDHCEIESQLGEENE
jgi:hypothetical protein